jgi:hypothetical protein
MLHAILAAALVAPSPNPYDIFARAQAYWLGQKYPTALSYDVAVTVTEGGSTRTQRYASYFDAVANTIGVDPESDYERAHPVVPKGVDIGILFWRVNKPLAPPDWLGVPRLAPNYSFGMAPFVPAPTPTPFNSGALVDEIRNEFHDPNPRAATPTPQPSGLSEIATVVAHNRDYAITLLGTDVVDGHDCFHLGLQPERSPGVFRIRQAWIDETSFATWKLVNASNFRAGPGTSVAWTIHFADIAGAHYISEEDAGAAMDFNSLLFSNVSFRFENVATATESPLGNLMTNGTIEEEP